MVVDGGHEEDAFAAEFEAAYLKDDRDSLYDEDEADKQQEDLTFAEDGKIGEKTSDGKASCVAHEDFRRIAVVPQKAHEPSCKRGSEDHHFSDPFDVRNEKVLAEDGMPCYIDDNRKAEKCDDRGDGCQPVQAVGEVDGVGCGKKDKYPERDGEITQIEEWGFEERHIEF